jgi:hypothetical protein
MWSFLRGDSNNTTALERAITAAYMAQFGVAGPGFQLHRVGDEEPLAFIASHDYKDAIIKAENMTGGVAENAGDINPHDPYPAIFIDAGQRGRFVLSMPVSAPKVAPGRVLQVMVVNGDH